MKVFHCERCGHALFFDNTVCLGCSSPIGYADDQQELRLLGEIDRSRCDNFDVIGCNWTVRSPRGGLCRSCALTRIQPANSDDRGFGQWAEAERAKRRLIFQLDNLGLPVRARDDDAGGGLAFDLLSSRTEKIVTGHDDGVITLDLAEADDLHREQVRLELDEAYRTLLGHFRHEIGHYYWPVLVADAGDLAECRTLFGDDRESYADSLKRHYDSPSDDWAGRCISRYAGMHPYEDWAETFAHYLHILDLLQTASEWGLPCQSRSSAIGFEAVVDRWLDLSVALNEINRSVGHGDLYPFVLSGPVMEKLAFVDRMARRHLPSA
ncbi:MAG: putative zinc-binding metallopeptidase [Acidimicrobiales bacterium]|nr:putative zinc-binding metallopeptidase [Acidimicrobiales bacterium]